MNNKRKGSCLRTLLILLLIVVLLATAAIFALKYAFAGDNVATTLTVRNADDAIRQLENLSDGYGYENALSDLTEKSTTVIDGDSYYRLQQNYQGIPVYGKTVVCVTDENNQVMSITGDVVDVDGHIDMTPSISKDDAINSIQTFSSQYSDLYLESATDVF